MKTSYLIFGVLVAMVCYQMHHDILLAIIYLIFWPIPLIKWLICKQLTLTLIKATFGFLLT